VSDDRLKVVAEDRSHASQLRVLRLIGSRRGKYVGLRGVSDDLAGFANDAHIIRDFLEVDSALLSWWHCPLREGRHMAL
jgi:hypothetical protein